MLILFKIWIPCFHGAPRSSPGLVCSVSTGLHDHCSYSLYLLTYDFHRLPQASTGFHGRLPRASTGFHGLPRSSTGFFHGIPQASTGFHGQLPHASTGFHGRLPRNSTGFQKRLPRNSTGPHTHGNQLWKWWATEGHGGPRSIPLFSRVLIC